ncbi:hypothetical protein Tco_0582056 [Tanacetum coccineum]
MSSLAFVEANYEKWNREATPILQAASSRVQRQKEIVVEFEDAPNREGSRAERNDEGGRSENGQPLQSSLTNIGGNPAPNNMHLSCNAQPFIPNNLQPSNGPIPVYVNPYPQPNMGPTCRKPISHPSQAQGSSSSFGGPPTYYSYGGFVYRPPREAASFQQKKFTKTHLAVHNIKQKEGESTKAFVTRSLVEFLSIDLSTTYKGLMDKTYTWIEAKEVITNGTPNDHQESSSKFKRIPPGTTMKEGRIETNSFRTRDLTTDYCPTCPKAQERSWQPRRSNSPYNLILGRTAMQKIGIVVSIIHIAIKFHTPKGVGTVLLTYEPDKTGEEQKKLKEASQEATKDTLTCMSAEEEIVINDKYPNQTVIGRQLPTSFKKRLQDLLKANADIFAWTYFDITRLYKTIMVGGRPFITEHKLNELKHMEPRKQKKRGLAPERSEALHKEVEELTKADILREVKYQTWVSNPVMIKKGKNLEVHVDDMVIKSDSKEDMLADIQETFDKLRAINMKLNPRKCSFSVEEGPFLGYLITNQGIKANPSKVKAIFDLKPPKMVKEIQCLNEKLAALSRFLLKGTDKALPFLKVLKNCASKKIVQWTQEAEEAF